MAAMFLSLLVLMSYGSNYTIVLNTKYNDESVFSDVIQSDYKEIYFCSQNIRLARTSLQNARVRSAIVKWNKRGLTMLAAPESKILLHITIQITIHGDIELNPGPGLIPDNQIVQQSRRNSRSGGITALSRDILLSYRKFGSKPTPKVMAMCKALNIFKYRSKRGGRRCIKLTETYHNERNTIKVVVGNRPCGTWSRIQKQRSVNLVQIPREPLLRQVRNTAFAVPKVMLINICSLNKTKNRVRAVSALEADMKTLDIDICVVSETHLKPNIPDTIVNIHDYSIYRRDRNWANNDSRCKGGVAVYIRNNITVTDVYRSNLYELICITLTLPSGHHMLVCGLYHPPKFSYKEQELRDYLIHFVDERLDRYPDTVFLFGGDLNHLDLEQLQIEVGWDILVNFPTRGDATLDNCLTNRPDLFGESFPFQTSIKTDHIAVVLPAGTKLKPIRRKVQIRDCRKHRKAALYNSMATETWDNVIDSSDVQQAVLFLECKILSHMDNCMPIRTISMSSRDPVWMTPLLKSMIRAKSRISELNKDRLKEINKRISEVISENRRKCKTTPLGSKAWWKMTDALSQRKKQDRAILDNTRLSDLNDYFAKLCSDDTYVEPTPLRIESEVETPRVSELQVWNILKALTKTATGPDQIPYWIWKEHKEILTPVITRVWNLSLSTQSWPSAWKRSNVNPLAKVEMPNENQDYRGISITPVIARAFERIVYDTHVRDVVENNLSRTQFAYRAGGNCTCALLAMQHRINSYMDDPDCRAVRLFTMDFSKAFDSVKHDLLASKLKAFPLNPYIINWYLSFLKDRKQRICYNGYEGEWKCVNRGTTQGSVSGPHLFNIFLNDLNLELDGLDILFKYADDSNIVAPVWKERDCADFLVSQFLDWTSRNKMICNPGKCKEMTIYKQGNQEYFSPIAMIPMCKAVKVMGVTFQCDGKFGEHVKNKLIKANKCLYILRSLRKEGYSQQEIDLLFDTLVLPNITYALSVYAASKSDLTPIEVFLKRCYKRKYTSKPVSVYKLLEKQDRTIFNRVSKLWQHPLLSLMPHAKETGYNLRKRRSHRPKVRTERFKNVFVNRLVYNYDLVID
ncbi:Hypothetical predicted protein [Paramuricea clavata]|uniref:Uncharacterized protein n=2 Tax=Paramuricea clavata TaxID=317549 RepID=A0A7D9HWD1_PARCT|nr:Hypothetical predicted protein [Paramuricea clavata]